MFQITKKLIKAKELFEKELEKIDFQQGSIAVIKNIDGTLYKDTDNIKQILANHIISPVRFDKTIKKMQNCICLTFDRFMKLSSAAAVRWQSVRC